MNRPWPPRGTLAVAAVALLVLPAGTGRPAEAGVHVGIAVGLPLYLPPYPYPYPASVYAPYYAPPVVSPAPPPPGFVPGHWETCSDSWGRPLPVWVPAHLR